MALPRTQDITLPLLGPSGGVSNHRHCSSLPIILRLPREIRDLIYEHCVRADDGYVYDFAANKLTHVDGSRISLSLGLTCRQIAHEFNGLALSLNTITFSSYFSKATQEEAGMFHLAATELHIHKAYILNKVGHHVFSADIIQTAAASFPQFGPIFDCWEENDRKPTRRLFQSAYGEAPSIWRDFIHDTLELVSKHPDFLDEAKSPNREVQGGLFNWSFHRTYHDNQPLAISKASLIPWSPPEFTQIEQLFKIAQADTGYPKYNPNLTYTYSAASIALRFLRSMSQATRAAIRKIILLEDRECVAAPECHGRGFIPFCQENRNLRIERFVNLWKSAFPVSFPLAYADLHGSLNRSDVLERDRLEAKHVTKVVSAWIIEAQALPSLGMPENSYTLILDGNPTPEHASEVFRVVQRNVAWQSALDISYACGLLPAPSWLARRRQSGYMYEGLPEAILNLSVNGSLIRCNFDPGPPHSIESLLEENRGWSLSTWDFRWKYALGQHRFQTQPPLPPWHELREGNVINTFPIPCCDAVW